MYCKGCKHLWTEGTNGKWCCKFGKKAIKAIGHCKLTNGRNLLKQEAYYEKSTKTS